MKTQQAFVVSLVLTFRKSLWAKQGSSPDCNCFLIVVSGKKEKTTHCAFLKGHYLEFIEVSVEVIFTLSQTPSIICSLRLLNTKSLCILELTGYLIMLSNLFLYSSCTHERSRARLVKRDSAA